MKLEGQKVTGLEPGTYSIYSKNSGINVYCIIIEELTEGDGDVPDGRPSWQETMKPSIMKTEKDDVLTNTLNVSFQGVIGTDGADMITARLFNSAGICVSKKHTKEIGTEGVIQLNVPESGAYTVILEASREGIKETFYSDDFKIDNFLCALAAKVDITSILTGKNSSLNVEWKAVKEAEYYTVEYRLVGEDDYVLVAENITDTQVTIPGLVAGSTYEIVVTAYRGSESTSGTDYKTVEAREERWKTAKIGSGESGTIVENADGSLAFEATTSKLAESEDQFLYYYTEVDPTSENFTLTATFVMDDVSSIDNQTGFGVIAIDTFEQGVDNRYFNSAGSVFGRFTRAVDGANVATQGIPGGRFVSGYVGGTTSATSQGTRTFIDTNPFDWNYRANDSNIDLSKPRFLQGEEFTLTLRKSNTGFHALMNIDGEDKEVICFEPDLLLQQDGDKYYVGVFAARKIKLTVKDMIFTTVDPEADDEAMTRPITTIDPYFKLDSTLTTSNENYEAAFYANIKGTIDFKDATGNTIVTGISIEDAQRTIATLPLKKGANTFIATLTPSAKEEQNLAPYTDYSSYEPIDLSFTVSFNKIGTSENAVYVSPTGKTTGKGTKASPVDIYTAVNYAQPGQEIVLLGGTYQLSQGIIIERGNSGTVEAPITLMSDPNERAVLDMSNSTTGGIIIKADYWHVYDIEICNTLKGKPAHIMGNYNIIEKLSTHDNKDTGLQISGNSTEPYEMWPSYNQIISCESYNNCDVLKNDADGFAAKIFVGDGNVFRYCISRNNIDDGWDLYAKSTSGSIGAVTIENCVAYENGHLTFAPDDIGEGNGFKLGGESMPGAHLLINAISFNNDGKGITSNSGPDCQVVNNISFGNKGENIYLKTNAANSNWVLSGTISFAGQKADYLDWKNQAWVNDGSVYVDGYSNNGNYVSNDWFMSTDMSIVPVIDEDGSIDMNGLLVLTEVAASNTGARFEPNPNPTNIIIGAEISSSTVTPTPNPTPTPDVDTKPDVIPTPDKEESTISKVEKPKFVNNVVSKTQLIAKGDKVKALTVNVTGENVTYQWYVNDKNSYDGATPINKATKSSYTPSSSKNGTKYYFCSVTNSDEANKKAITVKSSIAKITIKNQVESITIKVSNSTVKVGKTIKINAGVTPTNAVSNQVTYKSSNTKYATVSKTGVVTPKKAGKGKTVTITVTAKGNTKVKKTVKIQIK